MDIKEVEVNGIDTIRGLSIKPPKEIEIPYKIQYKQQNLLQGWNACYIAIIPYCFVCKIPLVWHTHPKGNTLFHCPNCNTKWIKDKEWDEEWKASK